MSDQPEEILTVDEVSACLRAGKRTVSRLVACGQLLAFELGGTWHVRRGELDQWIARRIGKVAYGDSVGGEE